jgi:dienelactone hydrolase
MSRAARGRPELTFHRRAVVSPRSARFRRQARVAPRPSATVDHLEAHMSGPGRSRSLALVAPLMLVATLATAARAAVQQQASNDSLVTYLVRPSDVDTSIHRFDEPNLVMFDRPVKASAPLLVFMPGTGGRPRNTSDFARVAAQQGYRVIGLEYDDTPAVAMICARNRDADCSEKVRRKRIFGDDVSSSIDDRPQESIVNRLAKLLVALDHDHPADGWAQYLENGQPNWARIAVSGLSQGAGMAAYIAQHTRVARAILFSSPWDNSGPRHTLAPWVWRGHGATPSDDWFAAYHARENTAPIIAEAYAALRIPTAHVRVFTLEPAVALSANPYHPSVVGNGATPRTADGTPAYLDEWRFLLGDVH